MLFLSIVFVLSFLNHPVYADTEKEGKRPEKNVKKYRFKIHRLQQGIIEQEGKVSLSEKQERTVLSELEILDRKLNEQVERLQKLESKMIAQQKQITTEENALKRIYAEKYIVQTHLQNRISSYYTMGDIGLLNVTFSTKTLPELLSFHDAFNTLIQYDKDVIEVYKSTIIEMERIKSTLDLEESVLSDFIDQTKTEKSLLEKTKNQKSILLTQIRTQAKLHNQAIQEMKRATQDLADSIVALKNNNEIFERGFEANKGSLPPPVDGVLITLFNQEKHTKFGISRKSAGIELRAKDGTNIIAISNGDVVFSGYLRGYGNTIVIYHGYKYYTITSRIEKILVKKGETIQREQIIGIMGDTATLFDEGLYFEIRHSRTSLDPLLWLNPNRLTTRHEVENSHIDDVSKLESK